MADKTEPFTMETFPWEEYDAMRNSPTALQDSEEFLNKHPEGRKLLRSRELKAHAERRSGIGG